MLALGEQIVQSLRRDDLLSRWMAHHISERMTSLATVAEEERAMAENEVADLILRLWEHGRTDAFDEDPVRLSESVMRAVAKLDPNPGERYFRAFGFVPQPLGTETESDRHLDVALSLDREAGCLMRELVMYAAATAEGKEATWIAALSALKADPFAQIRDLMALTPDDDSLEPGTDPLASRRESIAVRAAKLRALLGPLASDAPSAPVRISRPRRLAPEPETDS